MDGRTRVFQECLQRQVLQAGDAPGKVLNVPPHKQLIFNVRAAYAILAHPAQVRCQGKACAEPAQPERGAFSARRDILMRQLACLTGGAHCVGTDWDCSVVACLGSANLGRSGCRP